MKSIIQEVHEGLSEDERVEMRRLAEHRGVCPCALLKGWLMTAFKRLKETAAAGEMSDEATFSPKCSSERCDQCPLLPTGASVSCGSGADAVVGATLTL